uniref:Radical SAM protein n=1 Tax=candidate division WOR-3 bacterium TaxID=2052148 RepID=A0A7V0Z5M9_UNCW3
MVECGFIVEENTDELSFLKFRFYRGAFSGRNLSLILLPTRVCNFKCVYCFEKEINDTMTDEDCKNILQFVRREIYIRKPEALVVSWYGGEPLLAFNTIKNLSMELLSITKSSKIEYEAGIVTNGYLLDENIAQELVNLNVKLIQITLDGPAEIHNKRRPLKNGSPTFHKIRESIVIAKRHFPQVEIRLNVDKENADVILEFLKEADWLYGKNTIVRPGRLRDYTDECFAYSSQERGLSANIYEDLYRKVREITSSKDEAVDPLFPSALPVRSFYCGAQTINTFTIGPGCRVYKCTSHLNPGDEVGALNPDGKFTPNKNFINYFFDQHPCEVEPCKSCKILPLCMGGCQVIRKKCKDEDELKAAICDHFWSLLNKFLEKTVLEQKGCINERW